MESLKALLARPLPIPSSWIGKKSEFEAVGDSGPVYWVPEQSMNVMGKTTVLNNIRLNEKLRRDFPPEVVEYIFLHERGHADRDWFARVVFVVAVIGSLILSIILFVFALVLAGLVVPDFTLMRAGAVIIIFVLSLLVGWFYCRVQRNEELRAELYALKKLGKDEFRSRRGKWEEMVDRGFFARLQKRLFYPVEKEIISAYEDSAGN